MKRIFPSNGQNVTQIPDADQTTIQRLHQSQTSKAHLSAPSEPGMTNYDVIEKCKLQYLEQYASYTEQRFMESLGGLRPLSEKLKLLENFFQMFDDMIECLKKIENNLSIINFNQPNFNQVYSSSPENIANTIYKDIKTLEGLHLEMQFSSSLRFLETVLEALELDPTQSRKLYLFDVKYWSSQCQSYLNPFITTRVTKPQSKCCWD